MIIFGGWNGEDTMDDLYHYSFGNLFFFLIYLKPQILGMKSKESRG
jgi:hypothetical protein